VSLAKFDELPDSWRTAMQPTGIADVSGTYMAAGEVFANGRLVPSTLPGFFPPPEAESAETARPSQYVLRQVDATHLEVLAIGETSTTYIANVKLDRKAGEVILAEFSSRGVEESAPRAETHHVTLIRGRDGALYAKRTSNGIVMLGIVPAPYSQRVWARFPAEPP
jgi:hypothetical protein